MTIDKTSKTLSLRKKKELERNTSEIKENIYRNVIKATYNIKKT